MDTRKETSSTVADASEALLWLKFRCSFVVIWAD